MNSDLYSVWDSGWWLVNELEEGELREAGLQLAGPVSREGPESEEEWCLPCPPASMCLPYGVKSKSSGSYWRLFFSKKHLNFFLLANLTPHGL